MLGTGEMLLIAVVAIIVVDPKKLPDLMKGLGKAIGEFKQMGGEFKRTMERETEMADFEKRKAEAHEQLYGTGAQTPDAAATPEASPEAAPAQAAPASPEDEAFARAESALPVETPAEASGDASASAAAEVPTAPVEAPVEIPAEVPAVNPAEVAAPAPADPLAGMDLAPAPIEEPAAPVLHEPAAPPAEAVQAGVPAEAVEASVPAEGGGAEVPPPPPPSGDDAVGEGQSGRMSLFGHLADLRKRLTRCAISVIVGFLVCYAFAGQMLKMLMQPMLDALKQSHFIYTLPTEAFFTEMKVAFVAGIFAASPYIFYQIFKFVAPGLYSHEKRWIIPIAFFSALCFTCGALFGYFVVFPFGFEFFASYASDILMFTPKLDEYLDFVLKLLFAFGIVFELPLFLFFLARLGIVTHVGLRAKRKYAILGSFILAAALTPPDAVSQTMMAVPLCILYELGIWLAYFFGKKPKPAEPQTEPEAAA